MEILQPVEPQIESEPKVYNTKFSETQLNPKNVEFLAYLGFKDEMFNSQVMEKIDYLSSKLEFNDLEKLALKFGNDGHISKLDKILMFVKLSDQENDYKEKLNLISESKSKI